MNITKTVRVNEKCSRMSFIEVDICYRNETIVNVVLNDIEHHFQGQSFCCYTFAIKVRMQRLARGDALVIQQL